MEKVIRKITSGKQITLPPSFCKEHHLEAGELVAMYVKEGVLFVEPYQEKSKAVKKLEKLFAETPEGFQDISEDVLLNDIDRERTAIRYAKLRQETK